MFMLGMLGVGSALALGIALRTSAVAGVLVLTMMWIAEFPPAQHLADGSASGSTNPLVDYHIVYAIVLIVLATTYSGSTWGLGRMWAALPFVQHNHWAL